jgi:hypothetical protein
VGIHPCAHEPLRVQGRSRMGRGCGLRGWGLQLSPSGSNLAFHVLIKGICQNGSLQPTLHNWSGQCLNFKYLDMWSGGLDPAVIQDRSGWEQQSPEEAEQFSELWGKDGVQEASGF